MLHVLLTVENVAVGRDPRLKKQAYALLSHGYRVSVISRSDPTNRTCTGMKVYEYPAPTDGRSKLGFIREYTYSWIMAAWLTLKVWFTDRFDAIQVTGTPDIYFTIAVPFKVLGRPLVLDQRDPTPELYEVRFGRRGAIYWLLRWIERTSYRAADRVITVNNTTRELTYARGNLRPGKVTIVGNGPALARTRRLPPRPELKRGKRFLCCWIGVMSPQDQVDLALRAIDHLVHVKGRTDCQFAFVGDGDAREASELLAYQLDLQDWVSFPGWLPQEEAFTYLSTADLGLDPNLEDLVSSTKGMEYMAFSLPFVSFDTKETKAFAGVAAAYAPQGDAAAFADLIDRLLDDPAQRANMGLLGRRQFEEELAWEHQQTTYVAVYRELLGGNRIEVQT